MISVPLLLSQPQLPTNQTPQQQPMLIAPNILKELKSESPSANGSNDTSDWTQHVADDGRVYYYNKATKVSSWTKPDQLKTQEEVYEREN